MKRFNVMLQIFSVLFLLACQFPSAHAGITFDGDVNPTSPNDWDSSTDGYAGETGTGSVEVNGGSDLYCRTGCLARYSGSTGAVTVDGTGSTWTNSSGLYVGREGSGTLGITGAGAVSNSYSYIGFESGTTGVVTVDGVGSTWTNSDDLDVGRYGNGTLNITNGGAVSSDDGCMGTFSGTTGVVTVDGSGSTWTNSNVLVVGNYGNGTLSVTDGGAVSSFDGYIGNLSSSMGVVTVEGSGSTWISSNDLRVGRYGNGTLNITNGATVSVDGATYLGEYAASTGVLNFGSNSGTLTTSSLLASPTQMAGTGTINTRGLVSDIDLVFDVTYGLTQTLTFDDQPTRNVSVNLDMSGASGSAGYLGAGYLGNGSLTIQDGIAVTSSVGYIGYISGSTGVVTVDGSGSTWVNSADLDVGHYGNGTLNITDGGAVSNNYGYVGYSSRSTGVVTVDGVGSTWTNSAALYVGSYGSGTLNITGGGAVSNTYGSRLANASISTAVVTVDGAGSTWTNGATLYVGYEGSATLSITDGATVINSYNSYLGYYAGSTGVVTLDGAGSTWTNAGYLCIGDSGNGTLSVTGGAAVSAASVSINDQSLLAIDVGAGSQLSIGTGGGSVTNDGTVRILAGAGPAAGGVYSPIAAATWSGSGVYESVGGTWDAMSHEFTVSTVQRGASGVGETLDKSLVQRVLIDDGATGWSLGASFLAADSTSTLDFTATAIDGTALANLQSLLDDGESVLGAWDFTLAGIGYTDGDPAYLSFDVGAGHSRSALDLWHYDGSDWTEYDAFDLTCNGQYASFMVTGFSGYAVTAAVPEPNALVSLFAVALWLAIRGRRRKRQPTRRTVHKG